MDGSDPLTPVVSDLMERRPVPGMIKVIRFIIRPLLMVLTKRDWQGMENLPRTGGFVLAPNHISHLDPILISHFMLDNNIAPRFLGKDTLFDTPVIGWIVTKAEQIPVYRSTDGAAESLRAAAAAIESGQVITVYPEGTITRDPGAWPMSARTGAVRLALMTDTPLIPMMQFGAQEILWPYTKLPKFLPRKTIRIRIGPPIDLSDLRGKELTEDLLHEASDRLMDTITQMMVDLRGERPATPRIDIHTLGRSRTNYKESSNHEGDA